MAKKVDERHLWTFEFEGDKVKISQPEHDLGADEWNDLRTAAYGQLRADGFVPNELIDLVEGFKELTRVNLMVGRPREKPEFRFTVRLAEASPVASTSNAELGTDSESGPQSRNASGITASEALAFLLIVSLRHLKHEQSKAASPVRRLKLLPRSLIAEIAQDLLDSCATRDYPPGSNLCRLIEGLLDLDRERASQSTDVEARRRAVHIVAMAPNVGTRELAATLSVNPSTISRWRRSSDFQELVSKQRERNQLDPNCEFKGSPVSRDDLAFILRCEKALFGRPNQVG